VIEDVIEKVAAALRVTLPQPKPPLATLAQHIRMTNTYPAELDKLVTHESIQMSLAEFSMPNVWARVLEKSDFAARAEAVEEFNKENRWKKRGIAVTPVKYYVGGKFRDALVNVYNDGTVRVFTMDSAMLGLASSGCDCSVVRVFRQTFTLEDAIGSHACSLEANRRMTNGILLGCPLPLTVTTVTSVQTL
jgi:xanthine dehydrogenase molybdopterin-binding subunit B